MSPLDQTHSFYAEAFYMLTPAQKKIAKTFLYFEKSRRVGDYSEIRPSRRKIAEISKCSEESVKDFIEKYDDILLKKTNRRKKDGRHTTNLYSINEYFFEFMLLMEGCGFLNTPSKYKDIVKIGTSEDRFFLVEKWFKIHHLSTTNLPTVDTMKLPTINIFLSEVLRKDKEKSSGEDPKIYEQKKKEAKERKGFRELQWTDFTFRQKEKISYEFSPEVIRKTSLRVYPYVKENKVGNPLGYFWTTAYDLTREKVDRKTA